MNIHIYRQYDNRWRWLPYPNGGYYLNGSGCGCCAVTHCIIEMDKYKKWTPANVQPYMKQFAIRGSGTSWNGIKQALIHYGLKDVANVPTMPQLWRELAKGNRVGVLLFGSTHGPDGTVWTTGGHYIAFTGYRVKNGQHQLYLKDSGGRKHDGWYSYEKSMKGDIRQVWIGRLPNGHEIKGTPSDATPAPSTNGKLTVDGVGGVSTIKALQKYLKVSQDGELSGQNKSLKKYYPSITSVSYGQGGSATVRALQKWIGVSADGIWGQGTSKALQKKLGITADGIFGTNSVKALQKFLNNNNGGGGTSTKKTSSTTTAPSQKPASSTPANFRENIIDVSYVQSKTIDWKKVKAAGIDGAIIRCGFRGYGSGALNEDSMFMNHITGANKAGLKLGIYFFTEAINAAEGKAEAQFALKMLKKAGVKLTYPIAIDTENINAKNPVPRANSTRLSAAKRTEAIKAFCEEIKANGYEPMIYASTSWLNNQLQMSKLPYTVWVAQYNDKVTYKGKYAIWQYTSTARVNGINQVVDKSYCYVNYSTPQSKPTVQTIAATAVPMAPAPSTLTKSVDIIAQEVLDGKWDSGDARKQKLIAAGYDYDAVQVKVNELIKIQNSPTQTTLIDRTVIEVLEGKWGSGDERKKKLTAAGYNYDTIQKRVTEVAAHIRSRKEAMKPWFDACKAQRDWAYNARYNWGKWNKSIAGSKNWGTCITFPNVVAMRCGLIKEKGHFITSTGSNNDSKATQNSFYNNSVKAMNSINGKYWSSIKYPNKTTAQLVKEGKIKEGDIIGFMGHTASYAYKDSKGNLLFNHAGHAAGIYGDKPGSNRPVLNVRSPGMSKRLVYGVFSVNTFIVTTSCTNGTITYSDRYMAGQNVTITIKPNSGYTLKSLRVDGKIVSATTTYKINKIDSHHVIEAICETNVAPVPPTPAPTPTPTPTPAPKKYTGTLPSMSLKKSTAQVIADAIVWAKWIANDNSFHYGYGIHSHHNGCYFCGTNTLKGGCAKTGVLDYQKSYCCNPFVGAAWAHGGGDSKAWELCHKGTSWDFHADAGYATSSLFKNLGHPSKSTLKAGDVLCNNHHVALYIGNGNLAEAGSSDDNKRNSTKWNNSIRITKLTDARYKDFLRVHRYIGSVNVKRPIYYGDVSYRVKDLQKYLNWYFGKEVCIVDGVFGDGTLKYVKAFQTARKLTVDGIVGTNTIVEMGKVTK